MSNLFVTGLSGLQAFQRALDATSQNIANSNTEGYVRQRADFSTRGSSLVGDNWIGTGVAAGRLRRVVDDFLADQSRNAGSTAARLDVFASQSARVANLLGSSSAGLSSSLQRLQNAMEGIASEPASVPARQALLGELQATVAQLKTVDSRMREFETEVNGQLASEAIAIDSMASGLGAMNREIAAARATSAGVPNELLDSRDRLLDQLSQKVAVRYVTADDGNVNVFIGRGQPLVLGGVAARIGLQQDPVDGTRQRIVLRSDGAVTDITGALSGGSVGGLLDFRTQVLDPARNELGRIATVLGAALNGQHRKGVDLTGTLGGDLLKTGAPQALAPATNKSSIAGAVSFTDPAALSGADYRLEYDGSAWSARRLDNGAAVTLAGAGTVASPFVFDGIAVSVSGTPDAGDRLVVRPTREAVESMTVQVATPGRIAAALPVRVRPGDGNSGEATAARLEVLDATPADLRSTVTLQFTSSTAVSVNGAPAQAWAAGQPIEHNGWRLTLAGTPRAGDVFTVEDNGAGTGDNRNAVRLADLLRGPLLDAGTATLADAATRLASGVGATTQQAQRNLEVQQIAFDESVRQRQGISGVNLDEEAANLLRFQQAYQASAQLIRTANEVFRVLIDVVR